MHLSKYINRVSTVAGLLLLAGSQAIAQSEDAFVPVAVDRVATRQNDSISEPGELDSPLERLKRRSAAEQWDRAQRWQPKEVPPASPLPSLPEPDAAKLPELQPAEIAPPGRAEIDLLPPHRTVSEPDSVADSAPVGEPAANPNSSKWIQGTNLAPRLAAMQAQLGERKEPVRNPRDLKKLTEILPYSDYEPDADVRRDDPCRYQCPRPDSAECKTGPDGNTPMCPEIVGLGDEVYQPRYFPESMFTWQASNLCHNPLYFEDPALERYGHTTFEPIQPFISAGRFGVQLIGLPYQMSIDPIWDSEYALGWYRPGDCAPYKIYQIPWNTEAAIHEAAVWTGLFYLFP